MARILYFDCFSGASGDMVLGALIDAGLPFEELRAALGSLSIDAGTVSATKVLRAGVSATKFSVAGQNSESRAALHAHDHHHQHADAHEHSHEQGKAAAAVVRQHAHRTLAEIGALIDTSGLTQIGKARARDLFQRLGEAEAAIHQISIDKIHLHEVGALDSIIDIVGAVFALEWFHADRIVSSPLNVGGGMVNSAHGLFPVPAPATVRLLEGVPVYSSGVKGELVTPTGALIVSAYAEAFGPLPSMTIDRVGYGAGDRDPADTPNVLRVMVGQTQDQARTETIDVLECEIDDMNPQIFGVVMDQLSAAGALDVYFVPIQMKKNRPGTLITVLAKPEDRERLLSIVFRETTTIGVRHHPMTRERLDRDIISIQTAIGAIRFKLARFGGKIVNAAPEFEDCQRIAADRGIPVKQVQAIAAKAYLDQTA